MALALLLLASLLVSGPSSPIVAKPKFKLASLTELANNTSTAPINVDLTSASIEQNEVGYGTQRSAYWKYTPTSSYTVTFTSASWNSNMAICVTTVIGSCTVSTLNSGSGTSPLVGGTTYYIRVTPNSAARGTFIMTRGTVADNYVAPYDNFGNAQAIGEPAAGSPSAIINFDLTNLTTEGGEVAVTGTGKTGWFKYTPSASYTINLIQQGLGSSVATCVTVSISNCSLGTSNANGVSAYALTSGTTYYIRVNPNTATLGYLVIARAGNDNDLFANATTISELTPGTNTGSVNVDDTNATSEPGEGTPNKGRWWKYTPTATQTINISSSTAYNSVGLNYCLTTSISSCTVAYASGLSAYTLTSGTTYYIRFDNTDHGTFLMSRAANDNDQFANATPISELADGASTPTFAVDYTASTTDPGEFSGGQHSRWWTYSPTVNQTLEVTQGGVGESGANNFYQCVTTAIGTCSVALNGVSVTNTYGYALTAGTTYYIRLSSLGATDGIARFARSANDNDLFANATSIGELAAGANTGTVAFDLSNAGVEAGEISNSGIRSRWWKYTPTSNYSITIAQGTSGAAQSSGFFQCVGTAIGNCSVGNNGLYTTNSFSYALTSGTTYYLRIGTNGVDQGDFRITRSGGDNDSFANATVIPELSAGTSTAAIAADLSSASKEGGEFGQGQRSRWWSYTPTATQTINIGETTPSNAQSGGEFVCVTTAFGSCSLGDNGGYNSIHYAFNLTSGTTYYIRIASFGADLIDFAVSRNAADNDQFASAAPISEIPVNSVGTSTAFDLSNATLEPGEMTGGRRSRWWSYTPTSSYSLNYSLGTTGSLQAVAFFVSTSFSSSIASVNTTALPSGTIAMTSGTTYYFRISTDGPSFGTFLLARTTYSDTFVPPNDNFSNAATLTEVGAGAKSALQPFDVANATVEGGEVSFGNAKSAWWKYTATSSYTLDVVTMGDGGQAAHCLTTSFSSCTQGSNLNNGIYAYAVTAGTTYYLRISNSTTSYGGFALWRTAAGNDNFASATSVGELSAGTSTSLIAVDTSNATYEPGEVDAGDRQSLWWSYTPTSSYTVNLVSYGVGGDLTSCFTTSMTSCTQGSSNASGMFAYNVTSGTTYYIRMSGYHWGPRGGFRLTRAATANNDMFSNATPISEVSSGTASSNISYDLNNSTIEPTEVAYGEQRSLWWSYTPTSSYTVNVAISAESGPAAVCITTVMTTCTWTGATNGTYAASFTSGTTYYIRVSSNGGLTGLFSIRRAGTNNDNFANATPISELTAAGASTGTIAWDTRNATVESSEVSSGEQRSLWWSYTPTNSYTVDFMAYGGGAGINMCLTVSINTCTSGNSDAATKALALTSGTTYYIRLAGNGVNWGGLQLVRTNSGNDNFANAANITELASGSSAAVSFDTSTATVEPNETNFGQQRSLWWKYTPTASYTINVAANGDGNQITQCVTTVINSCSAGSYAANTVNAYAVTSGTTYYIRIAGNGWQTGTMVVSRDNPATNDDFANATQIQQYDVTAPTSGSVYDGTSVGVQTSTSNGSTTSLSANWTGFTDAGTGIQNYEYSIGTTAGGTSVQGWTSVGTATSVTATGLSLTVGSKYYVNVRATDYAGNVSGVVSSSGQTIPPTLTFTSMGVASSTSCGDVSTTSTSGNTSSFVDPGLSSAQFIIGQQLSVTTNAANGYTVNVSATPLTNGNKTIAAVPGTNAAPQTWPAAGTEGFGYATSSSTLSGTANRFRTAKFAAFSTSGSEVMKNTAATSGDNACVAVGLSQSSSTSAGLYGSTVTFTAIPTF